MKAYCVGKGVRDHALIHCWWEVEIDITSKEGTWQNLSKLCITFEPQHYFQEYILQVHFHMWKRHMFRSIFEAFF